MWSWTTNLRVTNNVSVVVKPKKIFTFFDCLRTHENSFFAGDITPFWPISVTVRSPEVFSFFSEDLLKGLTFFLEELLMLWKWRSFCSASGEGRLVYVSVTNEIWTRGLLNILPIKIRLFLGVTDYFSTLRQYTFHNGFGGFWSSPNIQFLLSFFFLFFYLASYY